MKNKQKMFFWSKIRNIVIATIISVFIWNWELYAINSDTTWYKLNNYNHIYLSTKIEAFRNKSSNSYFIPTKTVAEYNSFKAHLPYLVTKAPEQYFNSYTCWPGWTMWLSLYEHNWDSYAVQWSLNWVYEEYWSSNIDFVWPYNFNWTYIYRWNYVSSRWNCEANVNIYKVIVIPN